MKKVSQNFFDVEFIPEQIYHDSRIDNIWFIDKKTVSIAEYIRTMIDSPVIINDWYWKGQYHESGFRLPNTLTGSYLSMHKLKIAIDMKFPDINDLGYVRQFIKDKEEELMQLGMTTVERNTSTWIHVDCRRTGLKSIYYV